MHIHPALKQYEQSRHLRAFSVLYTKLVKDLEKLGCTTIEAEIIDYVSQPISRFRRFFSGPGYGDTEELLLVETRLQGCSIEIIVPIGRGDVEPPYAIRTQLPEPMTGRAEYRRARRDGRWHCDPESDPRERELERTIPRVQLRQRTTSKKVPVTCTYEIEVGHRLVPTTDGTEWTVEAAYEGSVITGGHRPMVSRYLEVLPDVRAMLRRWRATEPAPA